MSPPEALRLLETCLYVDDLDAAEAFYGEVLGLTVVARQDERHVFFQCGPGMLLLFLPAASLAESGELPPHGANGPGHLAFAVDESRLDAWRRHLQAHHVAIEQEVLWPNSVRSLYFRDPAGNSLELTVARLWNLARDGDG